MKVEKRKTSGSFFFFLILRTSDLEGQRMKAPSFYSELFEVLVLSFNIFFFIILLRGIFVFRDLIGLQQLL